MTRGPAALRVVPADSADRRPDDGCEQALLLTHVALARSGPADPDPPVASEDLAAHVARLGPRPAGTAQLVDAIELAGLTGRGGGHFPTAVRWRAALRDRGPLTVVANGAESEPASGKDGTLMRQRPHLVLDGLVLAAETLGARRAVFWLHGDDDGARVTLDAALRERRAAGLVEPHVEIVLGPVHYLSGESTAIAQGLHGGPTLPLSRRPRPTPRPGAGPPRTHVHNVETLARVALLARGLPDPAVSLLTLVAVAHRRVVQVPRGTEFRDVLVAAPEGVGGAEPFAVLLGGFGGTWVTWRGVARLPVDEPALRTVGLSLGAGIVAPLPQDACGLLETAAVARYLASMSARQCGPCVFGLPALARGLQRLAEGVGGRRERARIGADLDAVTGRGACHHPDGATRMIASALHVFADDVERHLRGRPCREFGEPYLPVPSEAAS